MTWFWLGLACGVVLTIPFAAVFARRTARRERRLVHRARTAERLAELGTLTGGLAHEIKNPLSTVGLNLQLMQEDLRDLERDAAPSADAADRFGRIQRRFDTLSREVKRLRDILEDFLRFAGRVKLQLTPTNVHEVIGELCDFFEPQAQALGVRLRMELAQVNAVLGLDAALFKQAMLNLMINACQAMAEARQSNQPHGGANELIIRTQRHRVPGHGPDLHIHVIDTGPGIPPEAQKKIFQPYYSNKKGGTGLGLPTTRRIIEEHHGTLTCHSEPGRGSDFTISLPYQTPGP